MGPFGEPVWLPKSPQTHSRDVLGALSDPPGSLKSPRGPPGLVFALKIIIFAYPSDTFLGKQRFRVQGVRHGTFADAHPPRENVVFKKKSRKGVQKWAIRRFSAPACLYKPSRNKDFSSSIKYQVSSIKYQVSGLRSQVSGLRYQVSSIKYQTRGRRHEAQAS